MKGIPYETAVDLVSVAAAQCYNKPPPIFLREEEEYIRARIKAGHESVIEHASASVKFTVDRGVTHELVRHRLCAFTQESTRFCDYSKGKAGGDVTFIIPPWFPDIPEGTVRYPPSAREMKESQVDYAVTRSLEYLYLLPLSKEKSTPSFDVNSLEEAWLTGLLRAEDAYLTSIKRGGEARRSSKPAPQRHEVQYHYHRQYARVAAYFPPPRFGNDRQAASSDA
jgi:thymidylate synthase ThyX